MPRDPGERRETNRLDRIENKLDKLTDYIVNVGRLDERVRNIENTCPYNSKRLLAVEKQSNDTAITVKGFVKLFWLVLSTCVVIYIGLLIKG